MTAPTTHYLNSDFDLGLRPRPRQLGRLHIERQVRELGAQALLGGGGEDCVLLRVAVPEEFLAYLADRGLEVPTPLRHPAIDPAKTFRPFGWSAEAIEINGRHTRPAEHPSLDVIRRVNARSLALELEAELAPEDTRGTMVASLDALESHLARAGEGRGWIVKSEHGNAGLANRRVRAGRLTEVDRRFVTARLAEDDRLLVEPWCERERDWCAVFDVPFASRSLRIHETVCTAEGGLIGARFDPDPAPAARWIEPLAEMARVVARRLEREGYFGPVCVDAFTWRDGDRTRLRPLVDLNCRRSMSDVAYRLWQRLGPGDRFLYYRFFARRKLDLGDDLQVALVRLGTDGYDRSARQGVLLASPLRVGDGERAWRPAKLAVVFVAPDTRGIGEMERRFRERFEIQE